MLIELITLSNEKLQCDIPLSNFRNRQVVNASCTRSSGSQLIWCLVIDQVHRAQPMSAVLVAE